MQGRPAPAVSLVHVRPVLQEEFADDQGALGSGEGQAEPRGWLPGGPRAPLPDRGPGTEPGLQQGPGHQPPKEKQLGTCVQRPPPALLTPSTACTSGVLPSSSESAQLTSAPWASAAASAGRSRVRAARCARSPGCSSRTSASPQASASPSASPLESSDSAPSARREGCGQGGDQGPSGGAEGGGGWGGQAPTLLGDTVHHGAHAEGQDVRAAVGAAP